MTQKQIEDGKKINEWLNQKMLNRECPFCRVAKWKKIDVPAALVGLGVNGPVDTGAFVPVIPVRCEECGLVLSFSLEVMGIKPPY
jgi:hypothetical protein